MMPLFCISEEAKRLRVDPTLGGSSHEIPSLDSLPRELLSHIFYTLSPKDLVRCYEVANQKICAAVLDTLKQKSIESLREKANKIQVTVSSAPMPPDENFDEGMGRLHVFQLVNQWVEESCEKIACAPTRSVIIRLHAEAIMTLSKTTKPLLSGGGGCTIL